MSETYPEITPEQAGKVLVYAKLFGGDDEDLQEKIADTILKSGDFSREGMRRAAKQAGADAPDVAHGDGSVPQAMLGMLTPDETAYRVVTYADGWEGVEAPGEVVRFFDAKGVRLAPKDDERVRRGDLTELEIARTYAKAGAGSSPYSELNARRSILRDVKAGKAPGPDPRAGRAGLPPQRVPTVEERKRAVAKENFERERRDREARARVPVADLYGRPQPNAK